MEKTSGVLQEETTGGEKMNKEESGFGEENGLLGLTPEEKRQLREIKAVLDVVFDNCLRLWRLSDNKLLFAQLLADVLTDGFDSFGENLRYHFGADAQRYRELIAKLYSALFERLQVADVALVRVAALQRLREEIAQAPPGATKVVDGQLLVKRPKLS
jgi:hypothetical protein